MSDIPTPYLRFQDEFPELYQAYENLGETAANIGPLDKKTRELIKLGLAASAGLESAVHSHTHRALEAGASAGEIQHTILLGITTIGFPRTMAALSWAKTAIRNHSNG